MFVPLEHIPIIMVALLAYVAVPVSSPDGPQYELQYEAWDTLRFIATKKKGASDAESVRDARSAV